MTRTDHDPRATPSSGRAPGRTGPFSRLRIVPVLAGLAFVLGGCNLPTFWAFRGATSQAKTEFGLWQWTVALGVVVAIIVAALILWAVFAYRKKDDRIPRQFHEHIPIEIIYTVIPVVLVGILFWGTVVAENKIDYVAKRPAEVIHVLGYRWGWRFSYIAPDGTSQNVVVQTSSLPKLLAQDATSPEYPQMVLPANSTIRIVLTSADVVHDFYVPEFNFGRYAQPGLTNVFDFTTTAQGVFRGQCSEYCGLYHSEMIFSVRVVPKSQFAHWLSANRT